MGMVWIKEVNSIITKYKNTSNYQRSDKWKCSILLRCCDNDNNNNALRKTFLTDTNLGGIMSPPEILRVEEEMPVLMKGRDSIGPP